MFTRPKILKINHLREHFGMTRPNESDFAIFSLLSKIRPKFFSQKVFRFLVFSPKKINKNERFNNGS